jgi:hypothetical protein
MSIFQQAHCQMCWEQKHEQNWLLRSAHWYPGYPSASVEQSGAGSGQQGTTGDDPYGVTVKRS